MWVLSSVWQTYSSLESMTSQPDHLTLQRESHWQVLGLWGLDCSCYLQPGLNRLSNPETFHCKTQLIDHASHTARIAAGEGSISTVAGYGYQCGTRVRFLSLARSKLRLCSANYRPGYWSNLPCDWQSTAWAYFEQETENGPRERNAGPCRWILASCQLSQGWLQGLSQRRRGDFDAAICWLSSCEDDVIIL